jgi:hypothetical protein
VNGDGSLLSPKRNIAVSCSGGLLLTSLRVSRLPKYGAGTGRVLGAAPLCDPAGKVPGSSIEGTGESFDLEGGIEIPGDIAEVEGWTRQYVA